MMRFANWCMVSILLLIAGCSLTPEYRRPESITPSQWKNESHPARTSRASLVSKDWWKKFGSSELDRLMTEALNNNLDLAAARERVGQFRALAKIAGAPLWPAISATGSYSYNNSSSSGNVNSIGIGNINGNGLNSNSNSWRGQWNMSYEVDLWGGIRAGRDSAKSHLANAGFSLDALRLVVMGDVARSYFAIVGLKERKLIAENNLNNIQEVLAIIVARFEAGAASALEMAQQKTELANAAAAVVQFDQQIAQSENALAMLLGRAPQQFRVGEKNLLPIAIPKADVSQPATLLDRRPDIRSAEAELTAAHADIGKARAAFYPRLQLSEANIFTAVTIAQPAGVGIALASALTAPIFQGGSIEGELERTLARRTELLEIYRKTILTAYQEVEDALALGNQSTRRREQLQLSVDSAKQAYQIARDRYLAGATDYQTLLIVQRSLLNAQDTEIQAHVDVLTASVLLFKSLGGGWSGIIGN
jgi:outer membrane protein, multidrug efflux system